MSRRHVPGGLGWGTLHNVHMSCSAHYFFDFLGARQVTFFFLGGGGVVIGLETKHPTHPMLRMLILKLPVRKHFGQRQPSTILRSDD